MTKPRRPILAAVCAMLLAAVMGLWALSYSQRCSQTRFGDVASSGGISYGALWLWHEDPEMARLNVFRFDKWGTAPDPDFSRLWFAIDWWGSGTEINVPLWALLPFPGIGLWWSWRRSKPKPGFPLELAKETA